MLAINRFSPFLLAIAALSAASAGAIAEDDPALYIARIEAPQIPNRQGFDGYSLAQIMQRDRPPRYDPAAPSRRRRRAG